MISWHGHLHIMSTSKFHTGIALKQLACHCCFRMDNNNDVTNINYFRTILRLDITYSNNPVQHVKVIKAVQEATRCN